MSSTNDPEKWLDEKFPKCKQIDVGWTMERYEFPEYVRQFIFEKWDKVNDQNGGTYRKPWTMSSTNDPKTTTLQRCNAEDTVEYTPPRAKSAPPPAPAKPPNPNDANFPMEPRNLEKEFQEKGLVAGCPMDAANAKAAAIMVTEGAEAAVKHMFTKPDGSSRSYSDMRELYG